MQREDQQNLSFSQENILANSIRIARERLGKAGDQSGVERDGHGGGHNQTFSFSRNKSSSMKQSSAAQAIKVLHQRIAELQAFNATLTKQTSQAKRELNLKSLQCQSLQSEHTQTLQKMETLKQKLSKSEKAHKQKQLELDELKLFIKEKQNYYKEKLSESQGKVEEERKLREGLEGKVRDLNKRIDNNQKVIVQMIRELEEEKSRNVGTGEINFGSPHVTGNNNEKFHKYSKSSKSKEYDNFPVIVDEPEGEADQRLKSRNNYRQRVASGKKTKANPQPQPSQPKRKPKNPKSSQKPLETITKQLQQKNKQLYSMLRTADRKNAESQKQKNEYKDKFYALKNAVDSILEEINRLPNGLAHKFKCWIVKVRKIESENLEGLRSFGELGRRGRDGRRFRSKSSRNTSKESSAGSKNKERQLKMQDLNLSDHNMSQTRSHSKSNRRSLTNYLKSATKHPKAESETETQPIKALTKKIREQRKELCQMYKKVKEETDPERELTLKSQFQAKMAVNVELQGELDELRRGRG